MRDHSAIHGELENNKLDLRPRIPDQVPVRTPVLAAIWSGLILSSVWILLVTSGSPIYWSFRAACIVAFESIFGIAIYLLCMPGRLRTLEAIGLGLGLGAFISGFLNTISINHFLHPLAWAIPASLGTLVIASTWRQTQVIQFRSRCWQLTAIPILLLGIVPIAHYWRENPISFEGWVRPFGDLLGLEAINFSISHLGIAQASWIQGQGFSYHWFGSAWMGHIDEISDAQPFAVSTRLVLVFALLGSLSLSWSWAARVTSFKIAPPIAAMMVIGSGLVAVNVDYGYSVVAAQFFATHWFAIVYLFAYSLCFTLAMQAHRAWPLMLLAGVSAFAATGSRITEGIVLCAAAVTVLFYSLGTRKLLHRSAGLTALTIVGAVAAFAFIYRGSSGGAQGTSFSLEPNLVLSSFLGMIPDSSRLGLALSVPAVIASVVASCFGVLFLLGRRNLRYQAAFGLGGFTAGIVGVFLFFQIGSSQLSFLWEGMAILLVPAGVGLAFCLVQVTPQIKIWRSEKRLVVVLVATLIFAVVVEILILNSSSLPYSGLLRWAAPLLVWGFCSVLPFFVGPKLLAPLPKQFYFALLSLLLALVAILTCLGLSVIKWEHASFQAKEDSTLAIHPLQIEAAQWVRKHTPIDSLFATNRQCDLSSEQPPNCRSNWFFVSGVGQRRTLVEGLTNGAGLYGSTKTDGQLNLMAMAQGSFDFAKNPSAVGECRLARAGVDYFWLDKTVSSAIPETFGIRKRFENPLVAVYELTKNRPTEEC